MSSLSTARRSCWFVTPAASRDFPNMELHMQGSLIISSPTCSAEMLVLYADALLGKGEYKRAKGYYRQVSSLRSECI
jgi:hypothetical protein